jgi:hypothetical protein
VSFVATLVIHEAITKREALATIAKVLGTHIQNSDSAQPVIELPSGSRVQIDVPKFGEAPPMAVDVCSSENADTARIDASRIYERLQQSTAWRVLQDW